MQQFAADSRCVQESGRLGLRGTLPVVVTDAHPPPTNNPQPTIIARLGGERWPGHHSLTNSPRWVWPLARNLQHRSSSAGCPIRCGARSGQESLSGWRRYSILRSILYKVRSSPPRGTGLNAEPRAPPIGDRITLAPFVLRSDEKSEKSPGASSMAGPSEAVSRGVQPRSSDGQPRQHGCTAAAIGPLTKLPCRRPEKPLTLPASSQGIWATGPLVRDKSVDSARAQLFFRSAGQPRRPKRVCRRQPVINVCWSWL